MENIIRIALIIFLGLCAGMAAADQRYNPHTRGWETTTDDAELRYNPHEDRWDLVEPGGELEYNPYEDEWEYRD